MVHQQIDFWVMNPLKAFNASMLRRISDAIMLLYCPPNRAWSNKVAGNKSCFFHKFCPNQLQQADMEDDLSAF